MKLRLIAAFLTLCAIVSPAQSRAQADDGTPLGIGSGLLGRVTAVTSGQFLVKTQSGETWTIRFSANTRFLKQPLAPETATGSPPGTSSPTPVSIKPGDVKPGDDLMAGGEVDRPTKSMGAVGILVLNPETALRMRKLEAGFGKTWLAGRVTAVKGTTITLEGGPANETHTFKVDENTTFRRGVEAIAPADIHPGDPIRVEGSLQRGHFVATTVTVVMPPARGGPVKPHGPPPR